MTSCDRCIAIYGENDPRVEPGTHPLVWGVHLAHFCTRHFMQVTDPDPSGTTSKPDYPCPACGGHGIPLDTLGDTGYFLCCFCGIDFTSYPCDNCGKLITESVTLFDEFGDFCTDECAQAFFTQERTK